MQKNKTPQKKKKSTGATQHKNTPLVLLILDGWGVSRKKEGNPFTVARTPAYNVLRRHHTYTTLAAHGRGVGLPPRQPGNSEAGHMNLGAGRVILQDVVHISRSINDGTFFKNSALKEAINHARRNRSRIHIMGLLGDENSPHADPDHLLALLTLLRELGMEAPYLHLFTDGRDSSPHKSIELYNRLKQSFHNGEQVVTIMGRAWAMDRKGSWSRTAAAYAALVQGKGHTANSVIEAITERYDRGETDEFLEPTIITRHKRRFGRIGRNDSVIFYNLRSDRARQLTKSFVLPNMPEAFTRELGARRTLVKNLRFIAMTDFGPDLPNVLTAYPGRDVPHSLPAILQDFRQLYIAESEKFAHVTYFFNGGYDHPIGGEDRVMINSPDIVHYDKYPRMQLEKLTKILTRHLRDQSYDVLVANLPNADMVGHTGIYRAGIEGIEAVDKAVHTIHEAVKKAKGVLVITADHGNVESMVEQDSKKVITHHSTNPVPFIIADHRRGAPRHSVKTQGILGDVAPTILELLGVDQPKEMTGRSLLKSHNS